MTRISGVYLIRNKINGKCYVGQSSDIKERFKSYRYYKNGKYASGSINEAISELGFDNFEIKLLRECRRSELDEYERLYIKEYNTLHPNGYNLTIGGKNYKHYASQIIGEDKKDGK